MITRVSFFVCLLCVALVSAKSNRIVGGDDAHPGQFKYQISLQENNKPVCGGAILADQYVLTAAHCVFDYAGFRLNKYHVVAGSTNLLTNEGVRIGVEKIYLPREFSFVDRSSDIAVLKLDRGFGLGSNPNLDTINLPSSKESSNVDHAAVIAGYGLISVDVRTNPSTNRLEQFNFRSDFKLKYCMVDIISNEECARKKKNTKINENHICGHAVQHPLKDRGICSGDSGGPLVHNNVVIGIASIGHISCKEHRYPAIYTRVSSFIGFIAKAMKGAETRDMLIREIHSGESSSGSKGHG